MYPHERSLVSQFSNAPFAIVGINSDADRDTIRSICKEKDLSWPSFFDGGGTDGPISTKWGVRGWPTIYVIDHEGIIRAKDVRGSELDPLLEGLVAKAQQ